ncbi:amino acid adenylation domain-containing protein [Actinocorallia longicatena]|uniref:AMP-dependent synthetase/ligase domain-containing protein n=1 Tax=Actinocorallia longicatena TaxID=111803 RepID=A0ABP6QGJ6_9ACTN
MTILDGLLGVEELPRLTISPAEIERARGLAMSRDHQVDLTEAVITRVERIAAAQDRPAVRDEARALTYAQLAEESRRIATLLEGAGVRPGDVVAVGGVRSVSVIAAFLALELLGALYVPADTIWPANRVADVLEQAGVRVLFNTDPGEITPVLAEGAAKAGVSIVRSAQVASCEPWAGPARLDSLDQPRYVLFTSGSTGKPKGAVVEHQGMVNHLYAKIVDLGMTEDDVVAQTAPLGFDISIWQMICPLINGGQVHVISDETSYDSVAFAQVIDAQAITIVELVPTMVRLLLDDLAAQEGNQIAGLRWMLATGEELPGEVARRWLTEMPQAGLVNAYGPTECSDDVTHHTVTLSDLELLRLPIGTPVVNTRLYVLRKEDDRWFACDRGETGELFVGGTGVGRGYLSNHDKTRDAFFADPFEETLTRRLYRTGDAVKVLPSGPLQYLGRVDRQVKISGVRMELGEIEAVLQRHPSVGAVAVVVHEIGL